MTSLFNFKNERWLTLDFDDFDNGRKRVPFSLEIVLVAFNSLFKHITNISSHWCDCPAVSLRTAKEQSCDAWNWWPETILSFHLNAWKYPNARDPCIQVRVSCYYWIPWSSMVPVHSPTIASLDSLRIVTGICWFWLLFILFWFLSCLWFRCWLLFRCFFWLFFICFFRLVISDWLVLNFEILFSWNLRWCFNFAFWFWDFLFFIFLVVCKLSLWGLLRFAWLMKILNVESTLLEILVTQNIWISTPDVVFFSSWQ